MNNSFQHDEKPDEVKPDAGNNLKLAGRKTIRIKTGGVPATVQTYRKSSGRGGMFGTIFSVIIGGIVTVAVLYYQGKINVPVPVAQLLDAVRETAATRIPALERKTGPGPDPVVSDEFNPPATSSAPGFSSNEDFIAGAKLFNQALADYNAYQQTRDNPGILAQVEQNARDAIARFEACRNVAPAHMNIGRRIDECYGLIANVRQSSTLNMPAGEGTTSTSGQNAPPTPRINISTVDSGVSPASAETAIPAAAPDPKEDEDVARLLMKFDPAWKQTRADSAGVADEIQKLLRRHAEPTENLSVNSSVYLYKNIRCMMSAIEAAEILASPLPVRRPVLTPGFPANSLFYYSFAGEYGWANNLTLVVDSNDRVVMSQLTDNRPAKASLDPAIYSPNWDVIDFVTLERRSQGDGLIAHQVRQHDTVVRITSELAASSEASQNDRMVKARVALTMPRELAGLILKTGQM